MTAPLFSLPDANGTMHSLSDYQGQWVLVYFYPKDDTPGCTKEACGFRDNLKHIQQKGVIVLGISKDPVASHKKFAEKYQLNFPILSDTSTNTIKAYGSWGKKKYMGREFEGTLRNTYLINPQGEIVKTYKNVDPAGHAQQILSDLQTLQ